MFTDTLADRFGRTITYLRLAVTDRCNLRCTYCMPTEGVVSLNHSDILSWEEMECLVRLLAGIGVSKVRLTGGEPFARKGVLPFLLRLSNIPDVKQLHITTNGVETAAHIPQLESMNLTGVNLSLDTLVPDRFARITRRSRFTEVQHTLAALLQSTIPLKINTVVQFGLNDDEIGEIAMLAKSHPIEVRFIEEMPFNGLVGETFACTNHWIERRLQSLFPGLQRNESQAGTASLYQVPGFQGQIGVISGAERTFCGSCNRIRITADGQLKTCLYDGGVLDLRKLLRTGATDDDIVSAIRQAVLRRFVDGHAAEQVHPSDKKSMSQIGG
ncbi:MAG: GTP 3',8-cyclase MoaA [Calditrichaeota bacterium]|nr:GTP 3',8-cyclase MoaA [Calditrichota bacterium]